MYSIRHHIRGFQVLELSIFKSCMALYSFAQPDLGVLLA